MRVWGADLRDREQKLDPDDLLAEEELAREWREYAAELTRRRRGQT